MSLRLIRHLLALALAPGLALLGACAAPALPPLPNAEIGTVKVSSGLELRTLVVRNAHPKGTVLLLHGFPETLYAWKDISLELGADYEVHAFDWPGYGLSSRPSADKFAYAPHDYARVLQDYIAHAQIDRSRLVIYATDIGALPVLMAALDEPTIARKIIVGDFAPFDRPQYMQTSLQSLKTKSSSEPTRAAFNRNRDDILENAYRRGFSKEEQFNIAQEFKDDMLRGWGQPEMTSADAFYHYYSHFTEDQHFFEANLARLKTPVTVIWGERDFYIQKEMGTEFAGKARLNLVLLPGVGHYPHLQSPQHTVDGIRSAFREVSP
jgi:pimeloyl-ACP methyl ester carboxylesterase